VLGYNTAELARTNVFEQIHPHDRAKVLEASRQARETGVGKSLQYRLRHKDGSLRVLESTASTIRNAKGQVEKLDIVNRDVTERTKVEEKLAHDALHDALTGLPNRRLFLERLQRCFLQARRDPNFRYAAPFVDIDAFKIRNDALGFRSRRSGSHRDRPRPRASLRDRASREVIDLILSLGRQWKLDIAAQGIEKSAHCEALKTLRCLLGQGYVFSHPSPPKPPPNFSASKPPYPPSVASHAKS
jgi:PAS domain S-box-containing protein